MIYVSDVLAERSRRTKSGLCAVGPGERCAAGGNTQHAGPGGVCRASAEQHSATACCPAPVAATNTPTGTEHRTLTGRNNQIFLLFPPRSLKWHIYYSPHFVSLKMSVCSRCCLLLWVCVFQSQRSSLTLQPQPASLYNTMMIPQQSSTNMVQIATSLAQNAGPNTPAVATFAQDRSAQIRFASSLKRRPLSCRGYMFFLHSKGSLIAPSSCPPFWLDVIKVFPQCR